MSAPATRARGGWIAAPAAVVLLFLGYGLLADAFAPAPSGQAGSAYATAPGGAAAWAELLGRTGHPVTLLRRPLSALSPQTVPRLIVLDPPDPDPATVGALRHYVRAGGDLVLGGAGAGWVSGLVAPAPRLVAGGARSAAPVAVDPAIAGVARVTSATGAAWTRGATRTLLERPRGGALLVAAASGAGRVLLLADASPVENRLLAGQDDAKLALDLGGPPGGSVAFAEAIHGYTEATGLAAIPTRWWIALAWLGLAGVAWAVSRARRLGPPDGIPLAPPPARAAYVESLAGALVRTRDSSALLEQAERAEVPVPSRLREADRRPTT